MGIRLQLKVRRKHHRSGVRANALRCESRTSIHLGGRHDGSGAQCRYVLGFNEPDGQQNSIGPSQAATLWIQYMNPRTSYKKVSPAVQSTSSGLAWPTQFFNACAGIRTVDYVAVHWNGSVSDIAGLQTFVNQVVSQFSPRPVWVNEHGFTDGTDGHKATAIALANRYLGGNSGVFRYAYFSCAPNGLLSSSGVGQSSAGRAYCTTAA
ncbi:hypothetical protein LTR95_002545 [Oleoguttula sp. CCFEE 5521]